MPLTPHRLTLAAAFALAASPPLGATTFAVFGDSITYGYGNPGNYNWTTALDALLPPGDTFVLNSGVNGAVMDSAYVTNNTAGVIYARSRADVFIIMLGTNNAKTANQAAATANFVNDYKSFIDLIANNTTRNASIYVTTPAPAFANGFGIDPAFTNNQIDSMVTSLAGYRGTKVIDLNDELMSLFSGSQSTYLSDGIHPTIAGDQAIAQTIYAAMIPEPASAACLISAYAAAGALALRRRRRRDDAC